MFDPLSRHNTLERKPKHTTHADPKRNAHNYSQLKKEAVSSSVDIHSRHTAIALYISPIIISRNLPIMLSDSLVIFQSLCLVVLEVLASLADVLVVCCENYSVKV